MKHYHYEFGLLFSGNSEKELMASIERYLNPVPAIKEPVKKQGRRRARR